MSRFSVGCCRSSTNATQQNQIVKISFNVQDECLTDTNAPTASHEVTGQAYPDTPNTYVNTARLRLAATDSGCAGVKNIEYRVNGETDWHEYSNELTFNTAGTYNVEYRATDSKDNVAAAKTATFTVLQINDTTAPTTNATAAGNKDQRDYFIGSATVTVTATDDEFGSGVHSIEYRVNGGAWNAYTAPVAFNAPGNYSVDYRATDKVQNTSAVKTLSFRILSGAGCTPARSDEFSGTTLGSQWLRHTRNGGTPTDGALAPTIGGGVLTIPTNNFEIDANNGDDVGRPGQLHRPGPAVARQQLVGGDAVHGASSTAAGRTRAWPCGRGTTTSSAPRSPTASAATDLHRAVQGQPGRHAPRARASRPAATSRSCRTTRSRSRSGCGWRASTRPQHRHGAVPRSSRRPAPRSADWVNFGANAAWKHRRRPGAEQRPAP